MARRSITATFPSKGEAERARDRLEAIGVSPDNIRLVEDAPNPSSVTRPGETGWHAFFEGHPHDEEALKQRKGVPRGPFVVGGELDEDFEDDVVNLLNELDGRDVAAGPPRAH